MVGRQRSADANEKGAQVGRGSGRYAMLDDGVGFSVVPWNPMIEQRLGQQLVATAQGSATPSSQ
jgi:Protein of unknown function (DUF3363)